MHTFDCTPFELFINSCTKRDEVIQTVILIASKQKPLCLTDARRTDNTIKNYKLNPQQSRLSHMKPFQWAKVNHKKNVEKFEGSASREIRLYRCDLIAAKLTRLERKAPHLFSISALSHFNQTTDEQEVSQQSLDEWNDRATACNQGVVVERSHRAQQFTEQLKP